MITQLSLKGADVRESETNVDKHVAVDLQVWVCGFAAEGIMYLRNLRGVPACQKGIPCFLAAMGKHPDFYTILEISKELFCKGGVLSEHPSAYEWGAVI